MTDELKAKNAMLAELSADVFGDGMKMMIVPPRSLALLKDNARFFKRETFRQLRDNIASDKRLSSVPLCYQHEDGKLEVLSGNHRVQASCEAKLPHILVLVLTEEISKSKRIAMQLAHNSLVGEDDQSILANLFAQIESIADKLYSGLDSDMVKELDDVELVNFSTPQVASHAVTFMFTDGEKESLSEVLDTLAASAKTSSAVYIAQKGQYEEFTKLIADIKDAEKIRDSSLALIKLTEIATAYIAEQEALKNAEVEQ